MEKKMLREIANDNQTPKKRDYKLEGELYDWRWSRNWLGYWWSYTFSWIL